MAIITIWQNFEMHSAELRKLGATAADVERLRAAAQAVEDAQQAADASPVHPELATKPIAVPVLNWSIQPPTKEARAWATRAVLCVTGGTEPARGLGQLFAILAGLWALHEAGEGRIDNVMRTISGEGRMAALVSDLSAQVQTGTGKVLADLAEVYLAAMGFQLPAPLARAAQGYSAAVAEIVTRLKDTAAPSSSAKASPQPSSSASAGKRSGAASPPRSSTPSSPKPSGANARRGRR